MGYKWGQTALSTVAVGQPHHNHLKKYLLLNQHCLHVAQKISLKPALQHWCTTGWGITYM
jgi:hypothetical protein